ncbi:MAG: DUF6605 domain-containing protein [Anaerolineae bacterium]
MKSLLAASLLGLALAVSNFPSLAQGEDRCANPANKVVAENCLPGVDDWNVRVPDPSVEVFVYPPSVNVGETIPLYVGVQGAPIDVRIYRLGYYGGAGARLITETSFGLTPNQPACNQRLYDTGLYSCLNWTPESIDTDDSWVSGVYLARVTRQDTQTSNQTVFVVRDDGRDAPLLFQQSNFTFQAYNNFGGKSVYNYNSGWDAGYCNTVSGHSRGVSVSQGRPYSYGETNNALDTEYPLVRWLEQQGYDLSYATDRDTDRWGKQGVQNELLDHQVFLSAGHDEYWTQEMVDAVLDARDAGVNLAFFSGNTIYWRVRLEDDPWTGVEDSVITVYKTSEDGVPDPSGWPTTTFRSADIGFPENQVMGSMYVGDNGDHYFPVRISGAYSQDELYRHTDLQLLQPDEYVNIGDQAVGWEWNTVVDNGLTPEGTTLLASSPTIGFLLKDEGNSANGTAGWANSGITRYVADSGATVYALGTILWGWGLGAHGVELVDADPYVQQITVNLLSDLGLQPASPSNGIVLDGEDGMVTSANHPVFREGAESRVNFSKIEVEPNASFTGGGRSATIRWETDRPTMGQIYIGSGTNNTNEEGGASYEFSTEHEIVVEGLVQNQPYFFRIVAIDEHQQLALSNEVSFQTPANLVQAIGSPLLREWRSLGCFSQDYPGLVIGSALLAGVAVIVGLGWGIRRWRRKHHDGADPASA